MQTVDGSKKDQREYHACGVGKKICSFIAGRSLKGRDCAREAKVLGGATVDRIKRSYIHAPAWRANRQKLYRQAYDMGVSGNDTYGITRIPTTVAGRGVMRRADQTDSTQFVYPGSGFEDA